MGLGLDQGQSTKGLECSDKGMARNGLKSLRPDKSKEDWSAMMKLNLEWARCI